MQGEKAGRDISKEEAWEVRPMQNFQTSRNEGQGGKATHARPFLRRRLRHVPQKQHQTGETIRHHATSVESREAKQGSKACPWRRVQVHQQGEAR